LISFSPDIASEVVAGTVPVEFRPKSTGCLPGTTVLVYASKNPQAVIGMYTAGRCAQYEDLNEAEQLLKEWGYGGWMPRSLLDRYLTGIEKGMAHEVLNPRKLPNIPLGTDDTGKKIPGPHSFRYADLERPDDKCHQAWQHLWEQVEAATGTSYAQAVNR